VRRGVIHPEVERLLSPLRAAMARAILKDGREDLAVVLVVGREDLTLPEFESGPSGARWTVMPRADALPLGRMHTLECGELLAERLEGPEAWVLALGPEGSAVVTLRWNPPPAAARN
jgi:hypothetical protein